MARPKLNRGKRPTTSKKKSNMKVAVKPKSSHNSSHAKPKKKAKKKQ